MCAKASMEEFEALLKESFEIDTPEEGTVVKGRVIAIEAGQAIVDVGYKMEGRVDLKEFASPGEQPNIKVGDVVEVYLDVEIHGLAVKVRCNLPRKTRQQTRILHSVGEPSLDIGTHFPFRPGQRRPSQFPQGGHEAKVPPPGFDEAKLEHVADSPPPTIRRSPTPPP